MLFQYDGVYIPNLTNDGEHRGIGQYAFAHNYELAGRKFELAADDGVHALEFKDRKIAVLDGVEAEWECEKEEMGMYFVRMGTTCIILYTDADKAVIFAEGADPVCCAIGDGEKPVAAGDNMVGTFVRWILGANKYVSQEYVAEDKIMTTWTEYTTHIGNGRMSFRDDWKPVEYWEEPVKAIYLGLGFYAVEVMTTIPEGKVAPADIKRMVMLQDYERCMTVGCAFGDKATMFAGYASFEK